MICRKVEQKRLSKLLSNHLWLFLQLEFYCPFKDGLSHGTAPKSSEKKILR